MEKHGSYHRVAKQISAIAVIRQQCEKGRREMVDEFQKEMTNANADWQLHSYGNTYHAFTNPEANDPSLGTQFNKDSNNRSWQSMNNFFEEIFS